MKITADTNVLVRALIEDDARQAKAAQDVLTAADLVALPLPSLCELAWVLSRSYKLPASDIAKAIRGLLSATNVVVNRPAAEAGLAMLDAGGDFADGAIAFEGNWLGAERFVSFDKAAVKLLEANGVSAQLL
jgi:predicted nucleic-acid-binding protein